MNLEKYIKINFGFQEATEILAVFEKHDLFSEIESQINNLIEEKEDQLQDDLDDLQGEIDHLEDKVDELEEEKESLEMSINQAKEKINNILNLVEKEAELSASLREVLNDLEA
jgi:outer membrane murein-binding lipoprotein Lpp